MTKYKVKKALIYMCNLAIPPNNFLTKGLGDLLNFDNTNPQSISPSKFIERNKEILELISQKQECSNNTWMGLIKILKEKFDSEKLRVFLEDFRIFAIKNYFSMPLVIKNLKLLNKSDEVNDKIDFQKDQAILSNLLNDKK